MVLCRAATWLAVALLSSLALLPGWARTLQVGQGLPFALPSQAAAVAADGDRIEIAPGTYADCAVWRANRLTIAATGPGVVIRDQICQGKALFVTAGNDITVEGITFAHAQVAEGNGAGIRAEGDNLTVRSSQFLDSQEGILAGGTTRSVVRISDSVFARDGACVGACAHGVYAGRAIGLLRVERSVFSDMRTAHHIKSRALRTELVGNHISDGPAGTSSYLVDVPNGGDLVMQDNVMEKGPLTSNRRAAIVIGAEGVTHPTQELRIVGTHFTSDVPGGTVFVSNRTTTAATLQGNVLQGRTIALEGPGTVQ
jgi:hypothetical protein